MMKFFIAILLFACVEQGALAQSSAEKRAVLERIAQSSNGINFAEVSAKLKIGVDVDHAYLELDRLLSRPYGDMFWMYGCAGLYFSTRDVLRPEYKQRIRECWKHFTPYRGDTENHFLMYYGSLFLMSQEWPDLADTEWFVGNSSKAISAESKEYLNHWIDETSRYGMEEFNSPRYDYYYITPLILLSEYTRDTVLKRRFTMMLDLVLADYASEYLDGSYCGSHSRVSDQAAIDPRGGEVSSYGQFFFEESVSHVEPDIAFAAMSGYQCPEIIRAIAHDRSTPFENATLKRGRTTLRDAPFRNAVVRKYDYKTKDYCLGSMQGGLVQPIQQQSWNLVFAGNDKNNILFSHHPNYSEDELGEFFPEEPSYMLEKIGSTKAGYPDENKWVGGSPYERIYQKRNMLVAMYDIPEGAQYHHVDMFIPGHAKFLSVDSILRPVQGLTDSIPGWITLQYDSTLVGIRLLSKYALTPEKGNYRIRTKIGLTAYWIICGTLAEYNPADFCKKLLELHPIVGGDSIVFTNLTHEMIRCKLVDLVDYASHGAMLFDSPLIQSKYGSGVITVNGHLPGGIQTLTLDFTRNELIEQNSK